MASPNVSDNRFPMKDKLEAVIKFAKLLERSDEEAMDAICRIWGVLNEVE